MDMPQTQTFQPTEVVRVNPTVVLALDYGKSRSYIAFDERGELIEANEVDGRRAPDWESGGICDHRGAGGAEGYAALHTALTAAETCARLGGTEIVRLPAA
jgi:hypothetical protein